LNKKVVDEVVEGLNAANGGKQIAAPEAEVERILQHENERTSAKNQYEENNPVLGPETNPLAKVRAEEAAQKARGNVVSIAEGLIENTEKRAAEKRKKEELKKPPPVPSVDFNRDQHGKIKPTYWNTRLALLKLGVRCRHDVFHDKKLVEGDILETAGPALSDALIRALREIIILKFGFDPKPENVYHATERACEEIRFDPVCDYLAGVRWDGMPRLDEWLCRYCGAESTPLNRAIGRKWMIAGVRRARRPGCKFDCAIVLEGPQGIGKSSVLRVLAGEENFSDQPLLGLKHLEQQEAVQGVWIFELAELAGIRKIEVESTKNFISRTSDNARPAYGHFRRDQPRRCVFGGTTNDSVYLQDVTGNRRFWCVECGEIDLAALRQDRDQLWAEAALAEASEEELVIPRELWGDAAAVADLRTESHPWEDKLAGITTGGWANGSGVVKVTNEHGRLEWRVFSEYLLGSILGIPTERQNEGQGRTLRKAMVRLGWKGPEKLRIGDHNKRGYRKLVESAE